MNRPEKKECNLNHTSEKKVRLETGATIFKENKRGRYSNFPFTKNTEHSFLFHKRHIIQSPKDAVGSIGMNRLQDSRFSCI
jgi:hypothetical protein